MLRLTPKSEKDRDKDKPDQARLSGTSAIASALNGHGRSSEKKKEKDKDKDKPDQARLSGTSAIASALNGHGRSSEIKKDSAQEQKRKSEEKKSTPKPAAQPGKEYPLGIVFDGGTGCIDIDKEITNVFIYSGLVLTYWSKAVVYHYDEKLAAIQRSKEKLKKKGIVKDRKTEFLENILKGAKIGLDRYIKVHIKDYIDHKIWWKKWSQIILDMALDHAFNHTIKPLRLQFDKKCEELNTLVEGSWFYGKKEKVNAQKTIVKELGTQLNYLYQKRLTFVMDIVTQDHHSEIKNIDSKLTPRKELTKTADLVDLAQEAQKTLKISESIKKLQPFVLKDFVIDPEHSRRIAKTKAQLSRLFAKILTLKERWEPYGQLPLFRGPLLVSYARLLEEKHAKVHKHLQSFGTTISDEQQTTSRLYADIQKKFEEIADVMLWQEESYQAGNGTDLFLLFIEKLHNLVIEYFPRAKSPTSSQLTCLPHYWLSCDKDIKNLWTSFANGIESDAKEMGEVVNDLQEDLKDEQEDYEDLKHHADVARLRAEVEAKIAKLRADYIKKQNKVAELPTAAIEVAAANGSSELNAVEVKVEMAEFKLAELQRKAQQAQMEKAAVEKEAEKALHIRNFIEALPLDVSPETLSQYRQAFINRHGSEATKEKLEQIVIAVAEKAAAEAQAAKEAEEKQKALEAKCLSKAEEIVPRIVKEGVQDKIRKKITVYLKEMYNLNESDIERLKDEKLILNEKTVFALEEGLPSLADGLIFRHFKKLFPDYKPNDVKQIMANEIVVLRSLLLDPGSVVDAEAEEKEINPKCVIGWQNFYMIVNTAMHDSLRRLANKFGELTASSDIKAKSRHFHLRSPSQASVETEQSVDVEQTDENYESNEISLP